MFSKPNAFRFSTRLTKSTAQNNAYKLPGRNVNTGTYLARLKLKNKSRQYVKLIPAHLGNLLELNSFSLTAFNIPVIKSTISRTHMKINSCVLPQRLFKKEKPPNVKANIFKSLYLDTKIVVRKSRVESNPRHDNKNNLFIL